MELPFDLTERYELTAHLARGGMADVYQGHDRLLNRRVAVKVLHSQLSNDDAFVKRFRKEAQAAANLTHPNIVGIYDWGQVDQTYFIVMELVEGRSLRDVLKSEGTLLPRRAVEIAADMSAALSVAHRAGLVHRDIKPGNILLAPDGTVKVTDFGIARVENSELTRAGTSLGTPSYMSPEQCTGRPVDARSDLFSIGIVLYQLLTGEKPFQGNSAHALIHHILHTTPERPTALNPALPASVDRLMERALAKNPADRFQSAEEFLQALEAALAGHGIPAPGRRRFWRWWAGSAASVYGVCLVLFLLVHPPAPASVNPARMDADQITDADIGVDAVVAPGPELSAEQQDKVARFLKLAKLSIDSGRLVWPPTSNAVYIYRLVLQMDPANRQAREGLRRVLLMLIDKAHRLSRANKDGELKKYLEVSLQAYPHSHTLLSMRNALTGRVHSMAAESP